MKERYFSNKFLSYFYSNDPKTHFDHKRNFSHMIYMQESILSIFIESTSSVQG
ncbi:hypothetical protein [Helicobacter equorum]|uniref:hypothetical protein n=1 Tax=Helicobacter equorum TaxID=361872 RepID=UPI001315741F|nr:hypothetical protein [Helicobacter equorum]